jgi:hypothetical protein
MKPYNGFESKKSSSARELLSAGGYVVKIMDAKEETYDWGKIILISFDVAEGEHTGFFAKDYRENTNEDKKWRGTYRLREPKDDGTEQDGWTKNTFGGATWAVEASNPGYHWDWDESKLKGKAVGVLYRNKEWEMNGNTGWTTECCALTDIDTIRNGTFKMPKDKPLKAKKATAGASVFTQAPGEDDEDLPF